ncbi:hypothetical protein L8Q74_01590 [Enterobacter roggenkampii]|nr:hypothetical protein [Enterobacter roggenkampii]
MLNIIRKIKMACSWSKMTIMSLVAAVVVSASLPASAAGAAPAWITDTAIKDISDSIIATVAIVGAAALSIMAVMLASKLGLGLIKSFISAASR